MSLRFVENGLCASSSSKWVLMPFLNRGCLLQMSVDDEDFESKIRTLFKEMDADSSTSLDQNELTAAVQVQTVTLSSDSLIVILWLSLWFPIRPRHPKLIRHGIMFHAKLEADCLIL
jgi:hypothetical protein